MLSIQIVVIFLTIYDTAMTCEDAGTDPLPAGCGVRPRRSTQPKVSGGTGLRSSSNGACKR